MAELKKVIEEKQWLSDRISTQVRAVGLGLLAISWGLLIGEPEIAGAISAGLKANLLVVGTLSLLALLVDFLQYLFGYLNTHILIQQAEATRLTDVKWDKRSFLYKTRNVCFWLKQAVLLLASVWFLGAIVPLCIAAWRAA